MRKLKRRWVNQPFKVGGSVRMIAWELLQFLKEHPELGIQEEEQKLSAALDENKIKLMPYIIDELDNLMQEIAPQGYVFALKEGRYGFWENRRAA
ncbi:MAG TPA: hypothetical protein PLV96_00430 [Methanoregulaceae archaeon]|jgi:hypothetical protein|nr:hypothetical protein [Methanoregulaceae archaeon]HQN17576.1 hypothetical protein [Syntrophobacteraceae bacterium]